MIGIRYSYFTDYGVIECTMNAIRRIAPPQSVHTNGSTAKTFLIKRAQLPRATFGQAVSSESGIGPSGIFPKPWRRRWPRCTLEYDR